jgi:hypothetical protein
VNASDRLNYKKLADKAGENVCWMDNRPGRAAEYNRYAPHKALTKLHVKDENQQILSGMNTHILLMSKVPLLRPLTWLIEMPLIRPLLAGIYHWQVNRRLRLNRRLKR